MAEQDVHNILTICGITAAAARNAVIQEGFVTVSRFARVTPEEIDTMVKNLRQQARGANQVAVRIGAIPTKNLKALVWWTRDKKRRGLPIDTDEFTEEALEEAITNMELETVDDKAKVDAPGQLKTADDWISWELSLTNYLRSLRGSNGVPLVYIIRKDIDDMEDYEFEDDTERLIYQAPHQGANFKTDNNQVYRIIKSKVIGTDILKWITPYDKRQDGRGAMNQLRLHYDGPGQTQRKITQAEAQIESLHYKSEQAFSFEKFITKLNGAFQVLEENGEALTERRKVTIMCDKIQNNNTDLRAAVQITRHDPLLNTNFKEAANSLSEKISSIFPTGAEKGPFKRKIAGLESNRGGDRGGGGRFGQRSGRYNRGGRGSGRGRDGGRSGRIGGRNNRTTGGESSMCNGVDLRDIDRSFSPDEWRQLPNFVRDSIRAAREAKKARRDQGQLRGVAAASMQNSQDDVSGITPSQQTDQMSNGAGRSFGRNAYPGRGNGNTGRGANNDSTS